MVSKYTADYHPSPSQLTSRIHPVKFLWNPKGFISPEFSFNFFLNLSTTPWLRKSFKFMVLRLLETTYVTQKLNLLIFIYSPRQKEIITPQAEGNCPFLPNSIFWRSIFPQQKERGEDYGVEEITKIKPTRVLVTSFDKSHHLCNLYIFGFCFVVP